MCTVAGELEYRINQMRKTLILIAVETGLNSDETLRYSQKLDDLITMYQKLKINNIKRKMENPIWLHDNIGSFFHLLLMVT